MTNPPCQLLEWDTGFFGFRIARVTGNRLSRDDAPDILDWCAAERIRCLYMLAASDDAETADTAAAYQFSFVDIRTTLERIAADPPPLSGCVRPATEQDIPSLAVIARASHGDSRFYYDPGFPRERCDALYAAWIEKSCRGHAQAVLVAERDSKPAGYIACNWAADAGQIGLIAVAGWARGDGLGRELVTSSLGVFQQNKVKRISVVTQGRNIASQRLYQRCGFLTHSVQIWYHRWFPPR